MTDLQGSSVAKSSAGAPLAPVTFPALFEARVREAPGALAVESADNSWTYEQLNARANQIAHWLIGRGIGPERLVAVAMPRSAQQIAVALGILKAGAAYLPWDLDHPQERIAYMAADAAPAAVLTTQSMSGKLPDEPATDVVVVDAPATAAVWWQAPQSDPGDAERVAPLSPAHAAYVIYTSGSTGWPKGVAVTHTGIAALSRTTRERLDLTPDARVLQVAAPSFDAAFWELVQAFTTGAALIVPDEQRLVADDLARALAEHRITHVMVPPSVLATLPADAPRTLTGLRTITVGGEACPPRLAAAWATDRRRFINAYGPTETTVCATISTPLTTDRAPLGSAVTDTRCYLLDDRLAPVPPGTPGELYVAGPALARGYPGHNALTAARFVANPFDAAGERMYRTGDMARMTAADQLEYLGRRDDQVKVRGLRIETGEVEAALAAHQEVRQAAVVVHEGGDGRGKRLVGYVVPVPDEGSHEADRGSGTGHLALERGLSAAKLRAFLARRLPDFMVPETVVVVDAMPLTPNGKVDKKALPRPEFHGSAYRAPVSLVEKVLTDAFADVLAVGRVSVDDDFFSLGGDSIQSLQVSSRARAKGVQVSSRQIFEHRTVSALAEAVALARSEAIVALKELDGGGTGWLPHLPVTRFLKDRGPGFAQFSQAMVLELPQGIDASQLAATLGVVIDHHDMLRARLVETDGGGLVVGAPGSVDAEALIRRVICEAPWDAERANGQAKAWRSLLHAELNAATRQLDPSAGLVGRFVWFDAGAGRAGRLLVVLHHLVVDGVSWRILLPDLATAWQQIRDGKAPELAPMGTSMRRWAHALVEEAQRPERVAELHLWRSVVAGPDPVLGTRCLDPAVDVNSTLSAYRVQLPAEVTENLLTALPAAFHCGVNGGLLAALAMAVTRWRGRRGVDESSALIRIEGHGREEAAAPGADLSRTIGWFTSAFPARLDVAGVDLEEAFASGPAAGAVIKAVKEQLLALPDKGIGYGLLRHLNPETAAVLKQHGSGQISFNYLGRFSAGAVMPAGLRDLGFTQVPGVAELTELDTGHDPRMPAHAEVDINATVTDTPEGPRLGALFTAPRGILSAGEVRELADLWYQALEALAQHTAQPGAGGLTPSDVPLVTVSQADIDDWQERYPCLSDIWPVAPLQLGLLVRSMMEHETGTEFDTYQVQYTLRLSGPVDPARLRTAARALLDRHPVLRTAYVPGPDGELVQLVVDGVEVPWQYLDLSNLGEAMRDSAYEQFLSGDLRVHFDPATPPMLRMSLLTLTADRHELVLTSHHTLFDGWSLPLIIRDLLRLYADRGDASALPRARSYREYLVWLAQQTSQASARAWAEELAGLEKPTLVAPDAAPDAERMGIGQVDVPLPAGIARELPRRAAEVGVTLNTLAQGAWGVVLGRLSGRQDIVLGATVAGRPPTLPGVGSIVGMFLNTLPVRVFWSPDDSFAHMLTSLQERQGALLDHQHHELAEIQRAAGLPALFDSLIGFESFPLDREGIAEASAAAGITVTGIRSFTLSHFPVAVFIYPDGPHLRLSLQYQHHLFSREQAEEMAALYARVLKEVAADSHARLSDVAAADSTGQERLTAGLEEDVVPAVPDATIGEIFERWVAEKPDAVALVHGDTQLTYRRLDERANRLAHLLRERGVVQDSIVAVQLRRSVEYVVTVIAILKAGGAYLPIDPEYPSRRLRFILRDAAPAVLVTCTGTAEEPETDIPRLVLDEPATVTVLAAAPADPLKGVSNHPEQLAHVIYTSGSTGVPKGVGITHRDVAAFAVDRRFQGPSHARVLHLASLAFDASTFELWIPLLAGGTVVVAPPGYLDASALAELITEHNVTALLLTPAMFRVFAEERPELFTGVQVIWSGGEVVSPTAVRRVLRACPGVIVYDVYGPTEITTAATCHPMTRVEDVTEPIPIGHPMDNMNGHVLDGRLHPVEPGVAGELYLSGAGLARGYLGRRSLTAERFVACPFGGPGERMYRTGDIVARTEGGDLDFRGRADTQVKIRGFRVEPGEIEAVLEQHAAVSQAVVVPRQGASGEDNQLVAYILPCRAGGADPAAFPVEELRTFASQTLPVHMSPAVFMLIDELPLTANGKVDKARLPEPESADRVYAPPRTPEERQLCDLIGQVLGIERVGVSDEFFALGGDSLLAARLTSLIGKTLGVSVPMRAVYKAKDIADLARTTKNSPAATRPRVRRMNTDAM
ncbi:amino acid adenylation domain-containing protein [Streptomyces milbemycinicus]|uniref:amino acid adenylation domain-containing protein n=1 Tax=Streptomyces milbemycinicus TaxID=476552 RepID=UPI0033DA2722